jgi:hypothetical protein
MAQNKVSRFYSKDLTIVLQFERLRSNADMSDMVAHEMLNMLANNKFIKDVLKVTSYKVNQKVTTVDWDDKNKSFQPTNIGGLVRKMIQ